MIFHLGWQYQVPFGKKKHLKSILKYQVIITLEGRIGILKVKEIQMQ